MQLCLLIYSNKSCFIVRTLIIKYTAIHCMVLRALSLRESNYIIMIFIDDLECVPRVIFILCNSPPHTSPLHPMQSYLEFFTSPQYMAILVEVLQNYPSVSYHIVNKLGTENLSDTDSTQPIAVTWGVFPGKEIVQPTVVDPVSFNIWKVSIAL